METKGWQPDPGSEARCWEQVRALKEQCKIYQDIISEGNFLNEAGGPSTIITKTQLDEITAQRDAYKTRILTLEEQVNSLQLFVNQGVEEFDRRFQAQAQEVIDERDALKEKIEGEGGYEEQIRILQSMFLDPMEAKENIFDQLAETKRQAAVDVKEAKASAYKWGVSYYKLEAQIRDAQFMVRYYSESLDKARAERNRYQARIEHLEFKGIDTRYPDDIARAEKRSRKDSEHDEARGFRSQDKDSSDEDMYDLDAASSDISMEEAATKGLKEIVTVEIRDAIEKLFNAFTGLRLAGLEGSQPLVGDSVHIKFAKWILFVQQRIKYIDDASVEEVNRLLEPGSWGEDSSGPLGDAIRWLRRAVSLDSANKTLADQIFIPKKPNDSPFFNQSLSLDYLLAQYQLYLKRSLDIQTGDLSTLSRAYKELNRLFYLDTGIDIGVIPREEIRQIPPLLPLPAEDDDELMDLIDDDNPFPIRRPVLTERDARLIEAMLQNPSTGLPLSEEQQLQKCREELDRVKEQLRRLANNKLSKDDMHDIITAERDEVRAKLKRETEDLKAQLRKSNREGSRSGKEPEEVINVSVLKTISIDKAEERIRNLTTEVDGLQAEVAKLKEELEASRVERSRRMAQRDVADFEIGTWKVKHDSVEKLRDGLVERLERATAERDEYKTKHEEAVKAEQALSTQFSQLSEALTRQTAERDKAIRFHSERTAERNGAQKRNKLLEESISEQNKVIESLRNQITELNQEINKIARERYVALKDFSALQAEASNAKAKRDAAIQADSSSEGRGEGPWAELLESQMKVQELQAERDKLKAKIKRNKKRSKGKGKVVDEDGSGSDSDADASSGSDYDEKLNKAITERDAAVYEAYMLRKKEGELKRLKKNAEQRAERAEEQARQGQVPIADDSTVSEPVPHDRKVYDKLLQVVRERDEALARSGELEGEVERLEREVDGGGEGKKEKVVKRGKGKKKEKEKDGRYVDDEPADQNEGIEELQRQPDEDRKPAAKKAKKEQKKPKISKTTKKKEDSSSAPAPDPDQDPTPAAQDTAPIAPQAEIAPPPTERVRRARATRNPAPNYRGDIGRSVSRKVKKRKVEIAAEGGEVMDGSGAVKKRRKA